MSTLLSVKVPIPEEVVRVSDSEGFAVRGLSPYHIVGLYKRHTGELEPMFQRVMAGVSEQGQVQAADIETIVMSLATEAPILLAEVVALATGGDPADTEEVTRDHPATGQPVTLPAFDMAVLLAQHLPFPVQTDALDKIGRLTFTSDMPPGKFFALVASLATKVTSAMQGLQP